MNDLILPSGAVEKIRKNQIMFSKDETDIVRILNKLVPVSVDAIGIAFPDPLAARALIFELEEAILAASDIQIELETTHRFVNGLYARELFIPKGTLLTGRIHRHSCISIMNKGDKTTMTEDGAMRIKAPFATISKPGIKRVGYAHEDTIWTTFHATDERDLKKIEEELFCDSYDGVTFEDSAIHTLVTKGPTKCQHT